MKSSGASGGRGTGGPGNDKKQLMKHTKGCNSVCREVVVVSVWPTHDIPIRLMDTRIRLFENVQTCNIATEMVDTIDDDEDANESRRE